MEQKKVSDFLADQRETAHDDLQHYFISFEDYHERKLWHELTDLLVEYYKTPESSPQRIAVYNNFVKGFADKVNQLKLVTIGLSTAAQYRGEQDGSRLVAGLHADLLQMRTSVSNSSQLLPLR